jgi:phospholipase/lecithinase/hemolysin
MGRPLRVGLGGYTNDPGYLFWDSVHPTTHGDALVAAAALQAVPEPATLTLIWLDLVGVAAMRLRSRRLQAA